MFDQFTTKVDQLIVSYSRWAGGFTGAAGQAAVEVHAGARGGRVPLEDLLDLVDAAARSVQFIAQQLVGGAGGGAETAVHATAQDGLGTLAEKAIAILFCKIRLHRINIISIRYPGTCGHGLRCLPGQTPV